MANSDYKPEGFSGNFTPLAELAVGIEYLDRTILLGRANFPRVDSLKVGMAALCDDEFMQVTALAPGQVAVKRGTGDTVPARHGARSLIWFIERHTVGTDGKEHTAGETNGIKYSPYTTGGGALPIDGHAPDSVTYNWRFFRPYPPGQMRVRGDRWYVPQVLSADNPSMQLTWAHRDRLLQADQQVDHDIGNIGPEPGTTYTVRIYDQNGNLKRTESGIMVKNRDARGNLIPPSWTYTWRQALVDLGFTTPSEEGEVVQGLMTIFSTRQGFDSWQGYEIRFDVDTQGNFLKVAQFAEMAAQPTPDEPGTPPLTGMFAGQFAQMAAQPPSRAEDNDEDVIAAGAMYVANLAEGAGQETSFYTPMNRNLFEAPYAHLFHRGDDPEATKLVTVVARPSDRLTDAHSIWTRYDWPAGSGTPLEYDPVLQPSEFSPWVVTKEKVSYLDDRVTITTSSFFDGISLADVLPGQVALFGTEMIRVAEVHEDAILFARGCYDTVPAPHAANTRIWFFQAHAGNDPTGYPLKTVQNVLGAAVQVKMVPDVYGPPLDLKDVPTDRVDMKRRTQRPYPPGQVLVNDKRWFVGAQPKAGQSTFITWVHRNRVQQRDDVLDHLAPEVQPEDDQKYRLKITVWKYPKTGDPYEVKIREEIVDGTSFEYTWEMAKQDGYRGGALLGVCGTVTLGLTLFSTRFGLDSWQGYTIPIRLPSYACPPGQVPGGGQLPPPPPQGGNGDTGDNAPGGENPGQDNPGDGPPDPIDNGGGTNPDNGDGPPKPPEPPPEWPDPIDPLPEPDPGDPNPALKAHWDLNWDRHWDAYNKDNPGD